MSFYVDLSQALGTAYESTFNILESSNSDSELSTVRDAIRLVQSACNDPHKTGLVRRMTASPVSLYSNTKPQDLESSLDVYYKVEMTWEANLIEFNHEGQLNDSFFSYAESHQISIFDTPDFILIVDESMEQEDDLTLTIFPIKDESLRERLFNGLIKLYSEQTTSENLDKGFWGVDDMTNDREIQNLVFVKKLQRLLQSKPNLMEIVKHPDFEQDPEKAFFDIKGKVASKKALAP